MDKERLFQEKAWEWELTALIGRVVELYGEKGFTSDEIWNHSRETQIPPTYIARHIGAHLESWKASGRLKKTGQCRLSIRNGSSTLPIFVSVRKDV